MVKNPQRIPEIHRPVRERNGVGVRAGKRDVVEFGEIAAGNLDCRAWIDAVKMPNPRRDVSRPPPAAATEVEASGARGQAVPGEDCEVTFEQFGGFGRR